MSRPERPIVLSRWHAAIAVVALLLIGAYVGLGIGQAVVPGRGIAATPTTSGPARSAVALVSAGGSSLPRSTSTAAVSRPPSPETPGASTSHPAGVPAFQDSPVIPGFGPTGPTERASVVRIVDGDTIHVLLDGVDHSLRYIGMDTPESVKPGSPVEPFALAASAANKSLVSGQALVLELDVSQTDRFGRLLRYVWLERPDGWLLVNLELVRLGFAQPATFPPDVKYVPLYLAAQRVARDAGRGQWAP